MSAWIGVVVLFMFNTVQAAILLNLSFKLETRIAKLEKAVRPTPNNNDNKKG